MAHSVAEVGTPPVRKPTDDELDVYGLTHPGKVRSTNQDHFLICSLRKQMLVHLTSLPAIDQVAAPNERLAFLAMVADGVGGSAGGETASRLAVEVVTRYVSESVQRHSASAADENVLTSLQDAANLLDCPVVKFAHRSVCDLSAAVKRCSVAAMCRRAWPLPSDSRNPAARLGSGSG